MLQHDCEEDAEQGWGKATVLFHTTADVEGLQRRAVKLNYAFHVRVEGLNYPEKPRGTTNPGDDFE